MSAACSLHGKRSRWENVIASTLTKVYFFLCSQIHEMVKAHLAASRRSRTPKGHWGPWTGWSECSTSCGGGVRSQTRQCLSGPLKPLKPLT